MCVQSTEQTPDGLTLRMFAVLPGTRRLGRHGTGLLRLRHHYLAVLRPKHVLRVRSAQVASRLVVGDNKPLAIFCLRLADAKLLARLPYNLSEMTCKATQSIHLGTWQTNPLKTEQATIPEETNGSWENHRNLKFGQKNGTLRRFVTCSGTWSGLEVEAFYLAVPLVGDLLPGELITARRPLHRDVLPQLVALVFAIRAVHELVLPRDVVCPFLSYSGQFLNAKSRRGGTQTRLSSFCVKKAKAVFKIVENANTLLCFSAACPCFFLYSLCALSASSMNFLSAILPFDFPPPQPVVMLQRSDCFRAR